MSRSLSSKLSHSDLFGRWMRIYAAILSLCVWTLVTTFAAPRTAHAFEEASVVAVPPDVPLVLQPGSIKLPELPARYETRDLGWLHIAYPSNARESVEPLIHDAETIKSVLSDELAQPVLERVDVRIARTTEDMAELAPIDIPPPAYASGVAYPALKLVLLSMTAPHSGEGTNMGEVFKHELSHIALENAVRGHHIPRWFNEGLAVYESGESSVMRARTLWDATLSGTVLPLSELDRSFPNERYEVSIAYAQSADFVRFLLRKADRPRFAALLDRVRSGQPFERALADAYGSDIRKLEFEWRQELEKRYSVFPILTGGSFIWMLVIVSMSVGYYRNKKKQRETLERWDREESAEYEARLRAAGLDDSGASTDDSPAHPLPSLNLPKVEHDGSWHTLH